MMDDSGGPDSESRRGATAAVRKMALSACAALGAQRGGTIDWSPNDHYFVIICNHGA